MSCEPANEKANSLLSNYVVLSLFSIEISARNNKTNISAMIGAKISQIVNSLFLLAMIKCFVIRA